MALDPPSKAGSERLLGSHPRTEVNASAEDGRLSQNLNGTRLHFNKKSWPENPPDPHSRARPDSYRARTRAPVNSRGRMRRPGPTLPLLGLSAAGMAVAGYLTYTGWSGDRAAYCEAGGGCDIVQASQWATFLGAPTALWGLLLYAGLVYVALRVRRPIDRWRRAWVLAFIGWGVSVYLTAISVFVIRATCPYCLGSLGIFTGIMALLLWQRPDDIPRFAWPKWLLLTAIPAAIVIAALHVQASERTARGPEDPYLRGLAERVADSGAVFYGASWCPHCQEQKAMFGASPGSPAVCRVQSRRTARRGRVILSQRRRANLSDVGLCRRLAMTAVMSCRNWPTGSDTGRRRRERRTSDPPRCRHSRSERSRTDGRLAKVVGRLSTPPTPSPPWTS